MSRSNSVDEYALKTVESYQYPNAHYGHLNEHQRKALDDFKSLCQQRGYFRPATSTAAASHDDETLLRYLRARKFVPKDAFGQLKETEDFRREQEVDKLYDTIDIEEYEQSRRLYPMWTGRRDKRGIPFYTFSIAPLTTKRISSYEDTVAKNPHAIRQDKRGMVPRMQRLVALYENLMNFAFPLCSGMPRPYMHTPVSQSNNIVDITGVGLKQFWNLKNMLGDASQIATAYYPETLDRIFIVGAPSFFPTIWSWIKRWFDPVTVSKIFILSPATTYSTLEQYVDPIHIPKRYGGKLDWEWGELPNLDPEIESQLKWVNPDKTREGRNAFPIGPIRWRADPNGDITAVAVGTENGRQREKTVAVLSSPDGQAMNHLSPALTEAELTHTPSGVHTHPSKDQEFFPHSGNTPPESVNSLPLRSNTGSTKSTTPPSTSQSTDFGSAAGGGAATTTSTASGAPAAEPSKLPPQSNVTATEAEPIRSGTSLSRLEGQDRTHAAGQLASGTPRTVDHGGGDNSVTVTPATVGQAPKHVDVPEAPADKGDEGGGGGILGGAKAAVGSAVAAASSYISGSKGSDGEGGTSKEGRTGKEPQETPEETEKRQEEKKAADAKIDAMGNAEVEDFIRSRYAGKK